MSDPIDDAPLETQEAEPGADSPESVGLEAVPTATTEGQDVDALRAERDQMREQLLRRRAEFDNFRKRTERERQGWATDAQAELLTELIPTLDHLDQALRAEGAEDSLREGVALIQRDLVTTLSRLGLVVHDPTGQPFDPSREQALSQEVTDGVEAGTVVETYRPGFLFRERLLRPALVKVAGSSPTGLEPALESPPEEVH
jgi:molecular chaperone GrpE